MNRLFFSFILLNLATMQIFAQAPQSFKYQAVVRNTAGEPYTNKSITMRIGIVPGSVSGQAVYTETHQIATTDLGLVNLEIGRGTTVTGSFAAINWGAGSYFVRVEFDATGGNNYTLLGTSQLLSVPYSLYADKAGNGFSGEYADLKNKPDLSKYVTAEQVPPPFSGNYGDLKGTPDLSKFVTSDAIPPLFSGSYNDLTEKPDLSKFLTAADITQGGIPKLQVSKLGDTLSLGKDNFVIIPGLSADTYDPFRMVLQKAEVVDVQRNEDGDLEISFQLEIKSFYKPETYNTYYPQLIFDRLVFSDNSGFQANPVVTGKDIWQINGTELFPDTRYLPIGTGKIVGLELYCNSVYIKIPPFDVTIPTGAIPKPKPVITNVTLYKQDLTVSIDDVYLPQYITYTLTGSDGISLENQRSYPYNIDNYGYSGYSEFSLGNIPIGTVISNIRVTDILGQESDPWDGTVTYNNLNSECELLSFKVAGVAYKISGTTISHVYPMTGPNTWEWVDYPVWPVKPDIQISPGATITPDPGMPQNFVENPITYVVTAEDGTMKAYTVRAERATEY